jgi:arylsulfatase A-like enzyme
MTYDSGPEGYAGQPEPACVTIAEVLKPAGYRTYMSGKWHVEQEAADALADAARLRPFYGTIIGAGSFYDPNTLTRGNDKPSTRRRPASSTPTPSATRRCASSTSGRRASRPALLRVRGLHRAALAAARARRGHRQVQGPFDAGWDALREQRWSRWCRGCSTNWRFRPRDPSQPPWSEAEHKGWLLRCMEVYAAQIDRMDQGIGRVLDNTPFRMFKHWVHEGGIATPLIAYWPARIRQKGDHARARPHHRRDGHLR